MEEHGLWESGDVSSNLTYSTQGKISNAVSNEVVTPFGISVLAMVRMRLTTRG